MQKIKHLSFCSSSRCCGSCYNAILPMSSPKPLLLLLLLILLSFSFSTSSPLSTIAISHLSNKTTLVCALLPSPTDQYDLNCTALPSRTTHSYPAGAAPYSAIAAGDGFLCALSSPLSSNSSTMRWWDFAHNKHPHNPIPDAKRVYLGPPIASLRAGDSHVCGLRLAGDALQCWRWPQLVIPAGLNVTQIAVGGDFVCVLLSTGVIKCFGGDDGVVGNEPIGNYTMVAAGSTHACGSAISNELVCWGVGAPAVAKTPLEIDSLALGENRTCALCGNGLVLCWGEDVGLPADLVGAQFIAIQARGTSFCGVLMANYSLVCWGSEVFRRNHVVFDRVLPGACSSTCPCGVVPDSASLCGANGVICRSCVHRITMNPQPNSTPITSHRRSATKRRRRRRTIFMVLGLAGLALCSVAAGCFLYYKLQHKNGRVHDSGRLAPSQAAAPISRPRPDPGIERHISALFNKGHSSTIEEFPIKHLVAITSNFSDTHKIGSGSFGSVYRATLDDGRVVAIKRAEPGSGTGASTSRMPVRGRQDKESAFVSELALLSRVNHKNLVRLLGYCNDGPERILVYEFMTNGTLHDLLHKSAHHARPPLGSWAQRIRIALDAARGIEYLHAYAVPQIIHRDIKSTNILLDENWTAKVSDFGLSLMSPDPSDDDSWSNVSLRAAGTVGYMDPEYYRLQHLTAKSDVYSFGVVLLEILSGCRVIQRYEESCTPKNVVEFAVPHIVADHIHRVLDARLPPPTPSEIEAVAFVGYLAADCVNPEGSGRPTMTEIVSGLERALAACPLQSG